ncbi:hypothetical protein L7F22_023612 [Adiantum nelumboides]|nr:hypothetical protein [Adiantum nelumboides]
MSLHLGSVAIVVASSPDMARLILRDHDLAFGDRSPSAVGIHLFGGPRSMVFSSAASPHWKLLRRISASQLFTAKQVDRFRSVRAAEARRLMRSVLADCSTEPATPLIRCCLRPKLMQSMSEQTAKVMTGQTLTQLAGDDSAGRILQLIEQVPKLLGAFNVGDYLPFLAWMDLQGCERRSQKLAADLQEALIKPVIESRRQAAGAAEEEAYFLDALLALYASSPANSSTPVSTIMGNFLPYGCQMHWEQCKGYKELKTEKNQSIIRNYRGWLCSVLVKLWWNRDKDSGLLRIPYLQTVLGRVLRRYVSQIPPNMIETAGYRMDGNKEEGSSSEDRKPIPTAHEIDESSGQAEKALQEFFVGGTDTCAVTIEWAFVELLKNPKKLHLVQEEIDKVVGRARIVEEGDIPHLPYLGACVKETLRLHPPVPLLMPHATSQACEIMDFQILPYTQAYVNVWAIGRDSRVWEHADQFLPERFLNIDPIDMQGQHFELLPFGAGRRICPGLKLALPSMYLILACLLQGFEWSLTPSQHVDMTEHFGAIISKKTPLVALAKPVLPKDLYT